MRKVSYSIGSSLREERFELEVSLQGRWLNRPIATFYLVEGVPTVIIGVEVPWDELRGRADDFFCEWAPNWNDE
jgi:hypothetical protein